MVTGAETTRGALTGAATGSAAAALTGIAVLIPAWQPGSSLPVLVRGLREAGFPAIIVIDDGSDALHAEIFASLAGLDRVHVLRHAVNLGKGRALKTGINHVLATFPNYRGVLTADADGQHSVEDIVRTATAFDRSPQRVVLGVRRFDEDVPLRSRFGNDVTCVVFRFLTGKKISDTQSGLRIFPSTVLAELLALPGERYEYEMTVLSHICRTRTPLEVEIATIYLDGNATSHFDPIRDSARIYFVLLRFYASSLIAAGLDTAVFGVAFLLTGNILLSFVAGRTSSLVNFALNKRFVFHSGTAVGPALLRYYVLAAAIAAASYVSIQALTATLALNVILAKVLVETTLSLLSFSVQRTFVFASSDEP